jgi:hypothetical protein
MAGSQGTGGAARAMRGDTLVTWPKAARVLGCCEDTLTAWWQQGNVPAVSTPGGQRKTYASFLDMVLASARPGEAPGIGETARAWWGRYIPEALQEVA